MLDRIISLNNGFIELYKNEQEKQKKYLLIKQMLLKNDCFMKISIECAYAILRDLNIPESDIKMVYLELIDSR